MQSNISHSDHVQIPYLKFDIQLCYEQSHLTFKIVNLFLCLSYLTHITHICFLDV